MKLNSIPNVVLYIEQSGLTVVRPIAMGGSDASATNSTSTTTTPRTNPHNRWQGLEKYSLAHGDPTSMRFGRDLFPFGDICNFFVVRTFHSVFHELYTRIWLDMD